MGRGWLSPLGQLDAACLRPRLLRGEYLTPWALGTAESPGGAASGGRRSSRGKAGGTEGRTGEGTGAFLPSSPAPGKTCKTLVGGIYPVRGLVEPCSPSRLWHSARADGSTRRQTARATCLITVSSEWPCPVAFVLMESKCQRDVNIGRRALGKSLTEYSQHHSPILSRSTAPSPKGSAGEPVAGRTSPHLILAEVSHGELMPFVLKSQFARRWPGPRTPPA